MSFLFDETIQDILFVVGAIVLTITFLVYVIKELLRIVRDKKNYNPERKQSEKNHYGDC